MYYDTIYLFSLPISIDNIAIDGVVLSLPLEQQYLL